MVGRDRGVDGAPNRSSVPYLSYPESNIGPTSWFPNDEEQRRHVGSTRSDQHPISFERYNGRMGVRPDEIPSRCIQCGFVTLEQELKDNNKLSRVLLLRIDNLQAALAKGSRCRGLWFWRVSSSNLMSSRFQLSKWGSLQQKKTRTQFVCITFLCLVGFLGCWVRKPMLIFSVSLSPSIAVWCPIFCFVCYLQVCFLSRIGGINLEAAIRNIMARVIKKEFGKKFSWSGKKNNISLGDSEVGNIFLVHIVNNSQHSFSFVPFYIGLSNDCFLWKNNRSRRK